MTDWPAILAAACRNAATGDLAEQDARRQNPGDNLRQAAVLIGVRDNTEPAVILTRRSADLRHHAGQISFPGGGIEPVDASPSEAACREAFEEIGLARSAIELLGILPEYTTVTGFSITPIVARIRGDAVVAADGVEAAEIIEMPLARVLDSASYAFRRITHEGRAYRIYSIDHAGHHVWGATASMLVTLARAVAHVTGRDFVIDADETTATMR